MREQRHVTRQMLRVAEAADALGLTKVAVWAAIRRGDIPARRIGRSYLIPRTSLEKLLQPESEVEERAVGRARS